MGKVRHIVIFVAKPGVTGEEIISLLKQLDAGEPGVLSFAAEQSLDKRKGVVIIENILFADERTFERFRISPIHKELGEKMSKLADWLVADYIEA
ncbi:MAG TPA: Dabb family protein [Candidatus Saccharimonadales bacterium]|nr:Dabb family protein [Candidatus Saccharimonadales bacterium]